MTDDYVIKVKEGLFTARLQSAGVSEQRSSLLSSPRRCLDVLQQGDTSWDTLIALCMHIYGDLAGRQSSEIDWQAEAIGPVLDAVDQTMFSPPTFVGEYGPREVPFDSELSCHVHSRVAASLLIQDDQPEIALQYLESVNEVLPPKTVVRLPRDMTWDFVERVRRPLKRLYEQFGEYQLALQLHILEGKWGSPLEHYSVAETYLVRWSEQLIEKTTVRQAKALLDAIYSLIVDTDRVDEEDRGSLADCPKDSRQFWAWFYGNKVGLLKLAHPYIKDALLHELDASDWVEGWVAASMLIEECPDWLAHRSTCMTLYWASDIEYKGARPWNARQPAHLSPSSDLYWAMRVGYCDSHIASASQTSGPTTSDLGLKLEKIEQIVSSSGVRHIRTHQEVMQEFASVALAIPTEAAARTSLEREMGAEVLDSFPAPIIEHLISAKLSRQQGRPDDSRLGTVKAIEAVFTRLIKPKLEGSASKVRILVTRPNGTWWPCTLERMGRIQLSEWATLLPGLVREGGDNSELRDALSKSFPAIDWERLGHCETGLRDASLARGQAAHDADRESYDHATREADRLWSIAVGSSSTPGLIAMLCTALGVGNSATR